MNWFWNECRRFRREICLLSVGAVPEQERRTGTASRPPNMFDLRKTISMNVTTALVVFAVLIPVTSHLALAGQGTSDSGVKPEGMLKVHVQTLAGKPMTNVSVFCIGTETNAILKGTTLQGGSKQFITDAEGRFTLPRNRTNLALVLANDNGFCLVQSRDLATNPVMVAQPWGRIEGVRINRSRPLANQKLYFELIDWSVGREISGRIETRMEGSSDCATTDSQGRFVFEHVPPVEIMLHDGVPARPKGTVWGPLKYVDVKPGETTHVEIATQGRTVVGQINSGEGLVGVIDFDSVLCGFQADVDWHKLARPPVPKKFDAPEQRVRWWQNWTFNTDIGRQRMVALLRDRVVDVHPDGSFVIRMVESGNYRLTSSIYKGQKLVAWVDERLVIPEAHAEADDSPFDLGKLSFKAVVDLKIGDTAPEFSVQTIDEKPLKLSDYQGKYVLLDFWATWCVPCVAETPNLQAAYNIFAKNKRFEIISLSLDSSREEPKKFVANRGIAWRQGFLGNQSKDAVTQAYGVFGIPQIMLIGPDGKIMARDLRGPKIKETVAAALDKP